MTSSDIAVRRPVHRAVGNHRNASTARIGAGIVALLALLVIGQRAAAAFDSPLLAVVVAGMLFLIGVAVHGAVGHARR